MQAKGPLGAAGCQVSTIYQTSVSQSDSQSVSQSGLPVRCSHEAAGFRLLLPTPTGGTVTVQTVTSDARVLNPDADKSCNSALHVIDAVLVPNTLVKGENDA